MNPLGSGLQDLPRRDNVLLARSNHQRKRRSRRGGQHGQLQTGHRGEIQRQVEGGLACVRRLQAALRAAQWNVSAVARQMGVSRMTLYRRMKRAGIVPPNRMG